MGSDTYEMKSTSHVGDNFDVRRLDSAGDTRANSSDKAAPIQGKGTKVAGLNKNSLVRYAYTISYTEGVPLEIPVFWYWILNLYQKREAFISGIPGLGTKASRAENESQAENPKSTQG